MSYEQASDPMAQQKNAQQLSESQTLSHLLLSSITAFDDHHDHLPSFAHYIIKDVILQSAPIQFKRRALDLTFFGGSLYQSPDLSAQTPPPDDSPLLVG